MSTTATGFERFVVKSWDSWDDVDVACYQFYDCEMNETFCDSIDFPFDRNDLFDVFIELEAGLVQVSTIDSEEHVIAKITGMTFQKS